MTRHKKRNPTPLQSDPALALHHGAFGPTKAKVKTYPIIGFDTEDDTKGTPLAFAFHDGENSFYTRSWDEAIDYIYSRSKTTIFVAHNLEYDIGNLFKACEYRYVDEMVYASRLLKVTLFGSHHFFIDTMAFYAGSLASLGKVIGLPKLPGNSFDKDYIIRDAQIPQVFATKMQKRLNDMGVNLGVSIGQAAMGIYRANYMTHKQVTYNSPNCKKAYYGGRVELFYKGVIKGPIFVRDIKSSYPDVMRNHVYPDTSLITRSSLATHTYGIGRFTIRVSSNCFIPPLPVHSKSGALYFPTGDITDWWTYAEVRYALSLGCTVLKEWEGEGTNEGCTPFIDFIDDAFALRQEWAKKIKANPNDYEAKFEDLFEKFKMNNLYGKFFQHKDSNLMTREPLTEDELYKKGAYTFNRRGPFYAYKFPRLKPPKTANFLWGAYITSYARISLLKKLYAAHNAGATLLYCDTDSVMFAGNVPPHTHDLGSNLGQMDEQRFDLAVFKAPKGYLLCDKIKSKSRDYKIVKVACKGVPTHLAYDFIVKGMAKAVKPMRLKEGIVRVTAAANKDKGDKFLKDVGVNVWKQITKSMQSIYIKRKGNHGVTRPIDVASIEALEKQMGARPINIETDLLKTPIRAPVKKRNPFANVKVPKDWFLTPPNEKKEAQFFDSQKVKFLKKDSLAQLTPGQSWFRGKVIDRRSGLFGHYYILELISYTGIRIDRKGVYACLNEKYFTDFLKAKKIDEKIVEFFLINKYDSKTPLNLRVQFRNPVKHK